MTPTSPAIHRIPALAILGLGIGLALAPHVARLPVWVTVLVALMIGWRARAAIRNDALPRKWLLILLVFAGVFAIWVQYGTLLGREVGITMLVLFLGLKLLETRHDRDAVVVTFLCYFLLLAAFFYSQTPLTGALLMATVIVLTAALVAFTSASRSWRHHFRLAGTLVAQAVPVAIVLFLVFPRIDGPLWFFPDLQRGARTGLSDSMSPGAISQLSQSDDIAFRVRFEGTPPPQSRLYWRGPVFTQFDGRTWSAGTTNDVSEYRVHGDGPSTRYEMIVEPHDHPWLFALEMPTIVPPGTRVSADLQILALRPVRSRFRYRAEAWLDWSAIHATARGDLHAALALPEGFNPQAVALAQRWRQELRSDRAILERALAFFRSQGLTYTISPPLLGRHTVDQFLFQTRLGFCEHFSSAFVVLMRAASIPARVVTGYQGGMVNPFDAQMTVRQADAHAWAEIWLEDAGWMRIDPTALAAPARVESGLAAALPSGESLPFMVRPTIPFLATLRQNWEAMASFWNQWVAGYDAARQRQFLGRMGFPSTSFEHLLQFTLIGAGIALLVVTAFVLRTRRPRDPADRLWSAFRRRLGNAGTPPRAGEGPRDFAQRARAAHPQAGTAIETIAGVCIAVRYGTPQGAAAARMRLPEARAMLAQLPSGKPWAVRLLDAVRPSLRARAASRVLLAGMAGMAMTTSDAVAQSNGNGGGVYPERADVRAFIREIAERHALDEGRIAFALSRARHQPAIVRAMEPVRRGQRSWQAYRTRTVTAGRIEAGLAFWTTHRTALERTHERFGVPPEIVVAIIGIETEYGRNTGNWRILDALATLAFDYPRRAAYFRSELEQYFLLARELDADPLVLRGSFAGAIGIPQFMPGSLRRFAVDFDGDGRRDLAGSVTDAIGSVGNFLKEHGWRAGEPIASPVEVEGDTHRPLLEAGIEPSVPVGQLSDRGVRVTADLPAGAPAALMEFDTPNQASEYWIGLPNFYVITRYNQSSFYALSVFQLAQSLKARKTLEGRTPDGAPDTTR